MLNTNQEACVRAAMTLAILGMISVVLLAACTMDESELGTGSSSKGAIVDFVPILRDLSGVDEIKTAFNQDVGQPRVILLLSPT